MREFRQKESKELAKIICNRCGKEIPVVNGFAREGVAGFDFEWGYFSTKDGEHHSFDLCEACYDEIIRSFQIPVEIEG
jgi:hypothetical protein